MFQEKCHPPKNKLQESMKMDLEKKKTLTFRSEKQIGEISHG